MIHLSIREALQGVRTIVADGGRVYSAEKPRVAVLEEGGEFFKAWTYAAPARAPGVLLLHTAAGVSVHDHAIAVGLCRAGVTCMLVRFTRRASGRLLQDSAVCARIHRALTLAVRRLGADPAVDPARISVFGQSLGGFFAAQIAASHADQVRRCAIWYGVYPEALADIAAARAHLLVVQGSRDQEKFVNAACMAKESAPDRVTLLLLKDAVHRFDLVQTQRRDVIDAWNRTIAFLAGP
jgi:dienelactone hydrolase